MTDHPPGTDYLFGKSMFYPGLDWKAHREEQRRVRQVQLGHLKDWNDIVWPAPEGYGRDGFPLSGEGGPSCWVPGAKNV